MIQILLQFSSFVLSVLVIEVTVCLSSSAEALLRLKKRMVSSFTIQRDINKADFPSHWCIKSHNQLFSSYIKRSRPSYLADFAEIWLAVMFWSPNSEMDAKKFQFFLLWEIPRRPTSSDLGGPPLWRIEGVLVTSILILQS